MPIHAPNSVRSPSFVRSPGAARSGPRRAMPAMGRYATTVRSSSWPTQHGWNTALYRLNAKINWKAPSKRIGHADVAFTMKQYVQTDRPGSRPPGRQHPRRADHRRGGRVLEISRRMGGKASGEGGGEAA